MSEWLKRELSRNLAPARAPEDFWDRIHQPKGVQEPHRLPWTRWAVAAALTLAATVGAVWLPGRIPFEAVRAEASLARPDGWAPRCTLPNHRQVYHLAGFTSWRSPVLYTLSVASRRQEASDCHQCHGTILN